MYIYIYIYIYTYICIQTYAYKPINAVTVALFKRRPIAPSTKEMNKTPTKSSFVSDGYMATIRIVVLGVR